MSPTTPDIRVGPAGWSYPDWEGIVYPAAKSRGFHEAEYLAQYFDTIEINTTFYHAPRPEMTRTWVRRVAFNKNFRFTAKLLKVFTHDRNASQEDEKLYKQGLAPIVEAGRLGALLLQFPWSFKNTRENQEYLSGLLMQFMEYPLVLEVRHASWNRPETLKWLRERGVGFCNIDQPVIGRSIAPSAHATAPVGYVRLHGRNYEHWFAGDRPQERYNYLYSLHELEAWAERISSIAQRADATYVVTNNHFRGKAVANALQLVHLLTKHPVHVPATLIPHYPELQAIASPEPAGAFPKQADLIFETTSSREKKI